jgi:hypothetical protein
MNKIILQHATADQKKLLEMVKPTNKKYADKFGFEYHTDGTMRCPERLYYWEKLAYIREVLPKFADGDLIVWEDSDSLNVGDESIENALPEGGVLGMVQLRAGLNFSKKVQWYNSGVMVMVNSPMIRDFMDKAWERNGRTDEDAICNELKDNGWIVGNEVPVSAIDPKWNCWSNNEMICKNPMIKTWHGIKLENKLKGVKDYRANKRV